MPQTREDRFYSTMSDLRGLLYGVSRYDADQEQGGVFCDLTPRLTLAVECFAQHNRWRIRLLRKGDLLEEWLTKARPIWDVRGPARLGLYQSLWMLMQLHYARDTREEQLRALYPDEQIGSAELQLAHLMEGLAASWTACARSSPTPIPLDELAVLQVYFASARSHPSLGSFARTQAETLDNASAWDECYEIVQRVARDLGATLPPTPPWPAVFA